MWSSLFVIVLLDFSATFASEPYSKCLHNVSVTSLAHEVSSLDRMATSFLHKAGSGLSYDKTETLLDKVAQGEMKEALGESWQIARSHTGVILCIAIGVLFVIGLPAGGILIAVNRCCFNTCGGKRHQGSGTKEGCCILTILLTVYGAFWIASVTLYLQSQAVIFPQVPKVRNGTVEQFNALERYIEGVQSEIHCFGHSSLSVVNESVLEILDDFHEIIVQRALDALPVSQLNKLVDGSKSAVPVQMDALNETEQVVAATEALRDNASSFYDDLVQNAKAWKSADTEMLEKAKNSINSDLNKAVTTTQGFTAISKHLTQMETDVTKEIPDQLAETKSELNRSATNAKNEAKTTISKAMVIATQELDNHLAKTDADFETGIDKLGKTAEAVQRYLSDENVKEYSWANSVLIVIAVPFLIILLFLFIGCIAGSTGYVLDQHQKPEDRGKMSHLGGLSVIVMSYSVFILVPIIVILIFALFLLGYTTETYACYPLFETRNDQYIALVAHALTKSLSSNATASINISNLLDGCQRNEGIMLAAGLQPPVLSIPKIDISPPKIDPPEIREMKRVVTEMSNNLNAYLKLRNQTRTEWADAYETISVGLKNAGEFLKVHRSERNAPKLIEKWEELDQKLSKYADAMGKAEKALDASEGQTRVVQNSTDKAVAAMDNSAASMTSLGYDLANYMKRNVSHTVNTTVNAMINQTIYDMGKCFPIYQIWENTGTLICHDILPAVNGLWFSLGIGFVVTVPTVAVGFLVSKYFLRMEPEGMVQLSKYER